MKPTLAIGDKVFVSKLHHGPKLPKFLANLADRFSGSLEPDNRTKPSKRLAGFSKTKAGDIIVFRSVNDNNINLIKRCVGLPGDVFYKKGKQMMVNKYVVQPINIYQPYSEEYGMQPVILSSWNDHFKAYVEKGGNLYIPKKGDKIILSPLNLPIYEDILKSYEKVNVLLKTDTVYINGARANYYTFKNNYYFFLGDNSSRSIDCRYFGFVPEDNIIGKGVLILFSNKSTKINWDRIFRLI